MTMQEAYSSQIMEYKEKRAVSIGNKIDWLKIKNLKKKTFCWCSGDEANGIFLPRVSRVPTIIWKLLSVQKFTSTIVIKKIFKDRSRRIFANKQKF